MFVERRVVPSNNGVGGSRAELLTKWYNFKEPMRSRQA